MRSLRHSFGVAVSAMVLTAGIALTATPASADLDLAVCAGSTRTTFDPPLEQTPNTHLTTSDTTWTSCTVLGHPELTSATRHSVSLSMGGCTSLLQPAPAGGTISWNTSQTSTYSGTSTVTSGAVTFVRTVNATVTSGLFEGSTVVMVMEAPSLQVTNCTLGLGTVPGITFQNQLTVLL